MHVFRVGAVVLFLARVALAQTVVVGGIPSEFGGTFPGAGPQTFVDIAHPANRAGNLTTASLVWSSNVPSIANCTAGFKIKIVRRNFGSFSLVAERGPFPAQAGFTTVTLSPPIPVQAGDLLAVVQLQDSATCGSATPSTASTREAILRYDGIDLPAGSFATGGILVSGVALMARASSDPNVVTAVLPVVGSTTGGFAPFRTDVQVVNGGNDVATGKLVFHPAGRVGLPDDPSIDYSYTGLAVTSISDIVGSMGQSGLGSIDVIPSSGIPPHLIARIYSDNGAAGTAGFTMDALTPDQALQHIGNFLLVAPADLTLFRMNVGVRTLDDGATISIFHGSSSITHTYAANYCEQGSLAAFIGDQPVPNGIYRVSVPSGSAFVYATTTDNRTNDTSIRFVSPGR